MREQHYRLTLSEAITRYQNRELTAKGLLRLYFEIRLRPGWEMKRSPREIYSELGISRTTFYTTYAALRDEGTVIGDDPDEKLLSIRLPIRNSGLESATPDCESETPDSLSATPDSLSEGSDTKSSKVPPDNDSATPSYFFQFFLNSLSDEERERFLKFAQDKAKAMPKPPQLIDAWIAKHHADLYRQFAGSAADNEARKEAIATSKDWRSDPRFDEWIKASFERSEMWVEEDEAEQEERRNFHRWAQKVNAYKGVCY